MARAAGAVKTGGVDQRAVFRGLQQDAAVVAAARIAVLGHREGDEHRGAGDPLPDQPERGQDLVEGGERLKEKFPRAELQKPFRDRQVVPGGGFRIVAADIREDARAGFFSRPFRERPARLDYPGELLRVGKGNGVCGKGIRFDRARPRREILPMDTQDGVGRSEVGKLAGGFIPREGIIIGAERAVKEQRPGRIKRHGRSNFPYQDMIPVDCSISRRKFPVPG